MERHNSQASADSSATDTTATDTVTHEHTNRLIDETSPYLLQHAHNPVDWHPWGEEALQKAREENKLIIVSIGYSACHWCHVMEHECFEDEQVAQLMNKHFVSIKVDREERPDIDQIYMDAVQSLTGSGGWPLNAVLMPNGKPVWGGTYFPKPQWMGALEKLATMWQEQPDKMREQSEKLTEHIQKLGNVPAGEESVQVDSERAAKVLLPMNNRFDLRKGGFERVPKFPLPVSWVLSLRFAELAGEQTSQRAVDRTLQAMARGGIYDHLGGGFARYSTDEDWLVPHFEKMLYDNAQLVSLYAEAYRQDAKPLYEHVIRQSCDWVLREMTNEQGGFYSSLDADSEGEEGKFYVWTEEEIDSVLAAPEAKVFKLAYNVKKGGNWEHGKNILHRDRTFEEVGEVFDRSAAEIAEELAASREKLFAARSERIHPGLDDKVLTSWNALMTKGFVDAYRSLGEERYLEAAKRNMAFLLQEMADEDGRLKRTWKNGRASINAYLDDYAFTIEALIALYEVTFDHEYLEQARQMLRFAEAHFEDPESPLFFYTSDEDAELITRKKEIQDNVIPSSNASLANSFLTLGQLYDHEADRQQAHRMLAQMMPMLEKQPSGFALWGQLMLRLAYPDYEVAIMGKEAQHKRAQMDTKQYLPHTVFLGNLANEQPLPLLENRGERGKTMIYVCQGRTCQLPTEEVAAAVEQIR